MQNRFLGNTNISISSICLGTMTFGEQVNKDDAHKILDIASHSGINFIDTAEMYPVPATVGTYGISEKIIGEWFLKNKSKRSSMICATKLAGPSRNMPWIRGDISTISPSCIEQACDASLKRLNIEQIDLYQIHWPFRHVPSFGQVYFDPTKNDSSMITIQDQLIALGNLVTKGKIRAIGLSNETPFGVHEFVRLADNFNLPRIVSVQNSYSLINRSVENALDESLHYLNISLLAYSPLAYGLLTGKYDVPGIAGEFSPPDARITKYDSVRKQRWGRPEALNASRLYNQLARDHGLTPVQLALAFCAKKWQVTSTIIGVTSIDQLRENIKAFDFNLSTELLKLIDEIRTKIWDPAN